MLPTRPNWATGFDIWKPGEAGALRRLGRGVARCQHAADRGRGITRRKKVITSSAVHPEYLEVVDTYVQHYGVDFHRVDYDAQTGLISAEGLDALDDQTAAEHVMEGGGKKKRTTKRSTELMATVTPSCSP